MLFLSPPNERYEYIIRTQLIFLR